MTAVAGEPAVCEGGGTEGDCEGRREGGEAAGGSAGGGSVRGSVEVPFVCAFQMPGNKRAVSICRDAENCTSHSSIRWFL